MTQKQLFEKLEKIAGIANLSKKERMEYDEALKMYRDCTNIVDYAEEKGEYLLGTPSSYFPFTAPVPVPVQVCRRLPGYPSGSIFPTKP